MRVLSSWHVMPKLWGSRLEGNMFWSSKLSTLSRCTSGPPYSDEVPYASACLIKIWITHCTVCQHLREILLPFLMEKFSDGHYRFMQDNDLKHTSHVAKDFYAQKEINWKKIPTSSADFNPIEQVWTELEHFIARVVNLWAKMSWWKVFWQQKMTPEKCSTYIDHTFKVLPLIVAKEGDITGEWSSWLFILNLIWTTIVFYLHFNMMLYYSCYSI